MIYGRGEGEFSRTFTKTNCDNSIISITKEDRKNFLRETKLQNKFKHPKIWKYGDCNDSHPITERYKIEEKLDKDLLKWQQKSINIK
jgi:hypothetical protein